MPQKITLEEINRLDREEFVSRFGPVFEGSPWVARRAWDSRPFHGLSELHGAMVEAVSGAPEERRLALIRAHPDLAGKAAVAGELTRESSREQASAGLDRLSPEEYDAFTRLNAGYREKFGFPMIVCVREHTRASILAHAEARMGHSRDEEVEVALGEIAKIARLRLQDLVETDPGDTRETVERAGGRCMAEATGTEIVLSQSDYGKSGVRLVKVKRDVDRHELWDLDVAVALEGDFEAAHVDGDNSRLLATDTMRNTVYALAKDHLTGSIEGFGLALVDHFLEAGPTVGRVRVRITEFPWNRIEVDGRGHEHSFVRGAGERTATVTGDEGGDRRVEAGIDNLLVMKTTQSGWEGFLHERFTTLPETNDRILATVVTANWAYNGTDLDFDRLWRGVHDRILTTFTDHYSPSVQNTLYRIGRAVLEGFPEVRRIRLSFPNKHHIPFDLSRFGIENDNEIFHATTEPYGLIEGTVERKTPWPDA